jgi:AcrR family transcriptional regulator
VPKLIDLPERERAVSEAAWRVMVRDGVTALSVRNVAAEAGMSPSSLRYSFPTQASVRAAAVELLLERLAARLARASEHEQGPGLARAMLLELLPLDAERRVEMEVTLAFGALALTDDALRSTHQRIFEAIRAVCEEAVTLLGGDPRDAPGTHALVDGLALHLVQQSPTADAAWAEHSLDRYLHGITPRV